MGGAGADDRSQAALTSSGLEGADQSGAGGSQSPSLTSREVDSRITETIYKRNEDIPNDGVRARQETRSNESLGTLRPVTAGSSMVASKKEWLAAR